MAESEPIGAMRWHLEIDGITVAYFKEVSGLNVETDVVEYRACDAKGTQIVIKIPGTTKWPNIVMKRGMTDDQTLWDWHQKVVNCEGDMTPLRHNGTITMFGPNGKAVTKFSFANGWPCKYTGPQLEAGKNEIAIEELEVAHMGLTHQKA